MSRTALLIALLLAFLLAVTWALTTTSAPPASRSDVSDSHTLGIDPPTVARVTLSDAEANLSLTRDPLGRWGVQTLGDGLLEPTWLVDGSAIDGALASMGAATLTPALNPHSGDRRAVSLSIESSGARLDMTVHPPVGARVAVYADPPRRWFSGPADAFEALTPQNVNGWRTTAALPSASVNADELTIEFPDADPIVLERHGSRWSLSRPVITPADTDAVGRLLSLMASLRFTSLRPRPDALPVAPPLSVTIATFAGADETNAGLPVVERLVFGAVKSGSPVMVARERSGRVYELLPADLGAIPTDPTALVSPFGSSVPLHDVAAITIDFIHPPITRRLRREIDGWTVADQLPDEPQARPIDADASEAEALLRLLLATRATQIVLAHPDGSEEAQARIKLLDVADRTLDECALVRSARWLDVPATRTGKVRRVYSGAPSMPLLLTP